MGNITRINGHVLQRVCRSAGFDVRHDQTVCQVRGCELIERDHSRAVDIAHHLNCPVEKDDQPNFEYDCYD